MAALGRLAFILGEPQDGRGRPSYSGVFSRDLPMR